MNDIHNVSEGGSAHEVIKWICRVLAKMATRSTSQSTGVEHMPNELPLGLPTSNLVLTACRGVGVGITNKLRVGL